MAGGSSGFPLVRYLGNAAHTEPASGQLSVSAALTSSDPETHKKKKLIHLLRTMGNIYQSLKFRVKYEKASVKILITSLRLLYFNCFKQNRNKEGIL